MNADLKQIKQILEKGKDSQVQIIDARSKARFDGTANEPRAGLPSGHMPNAFNIPFTNFFDSKTNELLPPESLKSVFRQSGVDIEKPIISSCGKFFQDNYITPLLGSGVTACVAYFAADLLNIKDVKVYDGSWTEYASDPSSIIETIDSSK